jgi:hypothetical protein
MSHFSRSKLNPNLVLQMSPIELQKPVAARPRRKGAVRPMTEADVPAVARLFLKIFRGVDKPAGADLQDYLRTMTRGAPSCSQAMGTHIFEQQDGRIRSALFAVPMQFVACGNVVLGRLLGVFMTDANKESVGAAELVLSLRPKGANFVFCDSASPTSCSHLLAIGGTMIPVQNLEWSRTFRPIGAAVGRLAEQVLRRRVAGFAALMRPLDALLRRLLIGKDVQEPTGVRVTEMPVEVFLTHAPQLIAHYAVRPLWSEEELTWLVSMAMQNTLLGAFSIQAIEDPSGAVIGSFVYYAAPGRTAHILNILSLPGQETAVLDAMFRHLDRTGHVEARGRAQPALMGGLALQPWLVFRNKAFALALTRSPDVNEAVARGDVYVGGLAGEDWSRLMYDFH